MIVLSREKAKIYVPFSWAVNLNVAVTGLLRQSINQFILMNQLIELTNQIQHFVSNQNDLFMNRNDLFMIWNCLIDLIIWFQQFSI